MPEDEKKAEKHVVKPTRTLILEAGKVVHCDGQAVTLTAATPVSAPMDFFPKGVKSRNEFDRDRRAKRAATKAKKG